MWLIESHSKAQNVPSMIKYEPKQIMPPDLLRTFPARPDVSQIVGAVKFGEAVTYGSKEDFDRDGQLHFVPADHVCGWGEGTSSRVGWQVEAVCMLFEASGFSGKTDMGFRYTTTFSRTVCCECGSALLGRIASSASGCWQGPSLVLFCFVLFCLFAGSLFIG